MRKALVFGANGLLGQHLLRALASRYVTFATDLHGESSVGHARHVRCDVTDFAGLRRIVLDTKPRVVFNAAAMTDVDGCEAHPELARAVNATAVGVLGEASREVGARVVQVSTDYVFDGRGGPYRENDDTNPVGVYGATKLQGERLLAESGAEYVIVRTNVLYGFGRDVRRNFALWVRESLAERIPIRVVTDQFSNPTEAGNLAQALAEVAVRGFTGVLNIGGLDYLDRYSFALAVAEALGLDASLVQPVATSELEQAALRPARGGLDIARARSLLKTRLIGVRAGLGRMKRDMIMFQSS